MEICPSKQLDDSHAHRNVNGIARGCVNFLYPDRIEVCWERRVVASRMIMEKYLPPISYCMIYAVTIHIPIFPGANGGIHKWSGWTPMK
jgi:hypothetical protein